MVQEKVQIKESEVVLDYLVDMDLGMCSCSTGFTGAACIHQAAIAKKFQLPCVNVAPMHSKEARHTFAIIARGEHYTRGIEFYVDLQEVCNSQIDSSGFTSTKEESRNIKGTSNGVESLSFSTEDTLEFSKDDNFCKDNDEWVQTYKAPLTEILEDLPDRLMDGDHNGIKKFIKSYKQMQTSQAPDSAIAYPLHNFGKSDC